MPFVPATKTETKTFSSAPKSTFKQRDFDKEAHGKTRCQVWCSVLQSPAFAQFLFAKEVSSEDILKEARKWADAGHDYTFGE